jgi:hypothetical protein
MNKDYQTYKLKGRSLEGELVGRPILHFSEDLTKDAMTAIASKIVYMDAMFQAVETTLSDGHIKSVLENLEKLQKVYSDYKEYHLYKRRQNAPLVDKEELGPA